MPVVNYQFNDELFFEANRRVRSQSFGRSMRWVLGIFFILLLGTIILTVARKQFVLSILFAAGGISLLVIWPLVDRILLNSFRKSPYRNENVRIEFQEDGVHFRGDLSRSDLDWSIFTKVVHFRDGFLLFQGPQLVNWIPVKYLDPSSCVAELEALLRNKIKEHKIIERVKDEDEWGP